MNGPSGKIAALNDLLLSNGARLHPNVSIAENEASGLHWHADKDIEPGSTIISVPHKLSLSYLNALVDEEWPVFKRYRDHFNPKDAVETITFFYLMIQYIHRNKSFWKAYLDALPQPDDYHLQPLFYDDPKDQAWLHGTDVWFTNSSRVQRYHKMFDDGKAVLRMAVCDDSRYDWNLFRWAAATFTSRSFNSRALHPEDSKYWAAHRHGKDGRSQAVLLDMSNTVDTEFPVLFPGLDVGNHVNYAKIDYVFDPGRFDIRTNSATPAGSEVFNNYGPKSNDELLLGYGFCIPNNIYHTVSMTLKPPPPTLYLDLRTVQPGYFDLDESDRLTWNSEKATFRISDPGTQQSPGEIFQYLSEALLELLIYILHHQRGYEFTFIEKPREYLASAEGSAYLPHIANIVFQSLSVKLNKLQSTPAPGPPTNARQQQAAIYRQKTTMLLANVVKHLKAYMRSLLATAPEDILDRPCLVRLETLVQLWQERYGLPARFMDGIKAKRGSSDLKELREQNAEWEDEIWILFLSALRIVEAKGRTGHCWMPDYCNLEDEHLDDRHGELSDDPDDPAHSLMAIVDEGSERYPESIWNAYLWDLKSTTEFGKILQFDSFEIECLSTEDGELENRFCVYLHNAPVHLGDPETVTTQGGWSTEPGH